MSLTVAVLQLSARPGDVTGNLERLESTVGALPPEVELAVAPELYTTGYDLALVSEHGRELAATADGPLVDRVTDLASATEMTLIVGFLEIDDDELFDSVLIAGGSNPVVYRKTHLYPAEKSVFSAGSEFVVHEALRTRLGMMICFEHAFPEVATTLALGGSEVLVIPSAVPAGYEHVLSLRTRARAQDNQVFAVGCNMAGPMFCGRSLIVDPRGEVVAEAGAAEETIVTTLDLKAVAVERAREPALGLRRPELYE